MTETGWIIPGSYIGQRITSFRWTDQQPDRGGIEASRQPILDGYTYTTYQGDVYEVKKGIITRYEISKSN